MEAPTDIFLNCELDSDLAITGNYHSLFKAFPVHPVFILGGTRFREGNKTDTRLGLSDCSLHIKKITKKDLLSCQSVLYHLFLVKFKRHSTIFFLK